jgi:acetyl-CoA acetyltransferase
MAGAAYFLDAVQTPFGRYGGALRGVRPDDLATQTLSALLTGSPERVNPFGGAIAIGPSLGAFGTGVLGSLVHRLVAAGSGLGLAAICIGVGQGLARVAEA